MEMPRAMLREEAPLPGRQVLQPFSAVLAVMALLTSARPMAQAGTVVLQQGTNGYAGADDTSLVQESPNNNHGGRTTLLTGVLGSGKVRSGLVRFDVSGLSGAYTAVNSMSLTLRVNTSATNLTLLAALEKEGNAGWIEGTVSGAAQAGSVCWNYAKYNNQLAWLGGVNGARTASDVYGTLAAQTLTTAGNPAGSTVTWTFSPAGLPANVDTLKELVDLWAGGARNAGVLLVYGTPYSGAPQWIFDSAETAAVASRPALTISATGHLSWRVAGGGAWDTTARNWTMGTLVATWGGGDTVSFTNVAGGTISIAAGGVAPAAVAVSAAGGTYTFTGGAIGGGATLTKSGAGTLVLDSVNAYTGLTTVEGGVLRYGADNVIGPGGVRVDGATAVFDLDSNHSATVGTVTLDNDGQINGSGTSALNVNAAGTYELKRGSVSAILSGTAALNKTTAGTVTLGGVNTYNGGTTLSAGTLRLSASGAIAGSPTITVASPAMFDVAAVPGGFRLGAAQVLQGSGTVTGAVATVAGSRILPGGGGTAGTLTFASSLELAGGTTNAFDLTTAPAAGGGTNDLLVIGGDLGAHGATIAINPLGPLTVGTPYRLINYAGSQSGSFNPAVAYAVPDTRCLFALSETAQRVDVTLASAETNLVWSGGTNGRWDLKTSANWNGNAEMFYAADHVTFDDTGATATVALAGTLLPQTVCVTNDTLDYSFGGTGSIGGSTPLIKAGTGMLTLANTNAYTGGTTILAGTVRLGSATGLGTAANARLTFGPATATGRLQLNGNSVTLVGLTSDATPGTPVVESGSDTAGTDTLTVNNTAAGAFAGVLQDGSTRWLALLKTGPGTLTLGGVNTYRGTTTLAGGTLLLGGGNNRLPATTALAFTGAATLDVGATVQTLANLSVASGVAGVVTGSGGTLRLGGSAFSIGAASTGDIALDLSGLETFTYNNAGQAFQVTSGGGVDSGSGWDSTVRLAAVSTITAASFVVGGGGSANITDISADEVDLGQTTTIHANTVVVGQGRNKGTLKFQPGRTNPTLTLRGADGVAPVSTLYVGEINSGGASLRVNTFDTTGGTFDARVETLIVAYNDRGKGGDTPSNSKLLMGNGTLEATALTLGKDKAGSTGGAACSGTLSVSGGTVKVETLILGDRTGGLTVTGILNLDSGGTLAARTVRPGSGAATRTINWNDGTLTTYDTHSDLTVGSGLAVNLASGGTHVFDIGTGRSGSVAAVLGGGGALVKRGGGTLTLSGANTYAGGTTVSNGTLAVNNAVGSSGTGAGAVRVGTGGTLAGGGFVGGPVTLAGTVAPGVADVGTLTINNTLAILENSAFTWEANGLAGDLVQVNGDVVLPARLRLTVSGNLPVPAVVLRWTGANTGAANLDGWQISGSARARIVDKEVRLDSGMLLIVR